MSSLAKHGIRQIEAAILENIDLDAFEDREACAFAVDAVDLADLLADARRIEAVRHGRRGGCDRSAPCIGSPRLRGLGHGFDRRRAVGPIGMDMKVAANVGSGDQHRQVAGLGERDLAAILAHFRRNISKPELSVDLLLGRAGDAPLAGEQTVFIELPAAVDRRLPRSAMLCALEPVK